MTGFNQKQHTHTHTLTYTQTRIDNPILNCLRSKGTTSKTHESNEIDFPYTSSPSSFSHSPPPPPHYSSTLTPAFSFLTSLKCSWWCPRLFVCNQWRAPQSPRLRRSCHGKFCPTTASSVAVEEDRPIRLVLPLQKQPNAIVPEFLYSHIKHKKLFLQMSSRYFKWILLSSI